MPIGEKLPFADIVVRNDGSQEETRKALNAVWNGLIQRERLRRGGGTFCSPANH